MKKYGTRWLADDLGVSLARARKLLAEGRIIGAWKNPATGEWLIPEGQYELHRGCRGPRLRVVAGAWERALAEFVLPPVMVPVVVCSEDRETFGFDSGGVVAGEAKERAFKLALVHAAEAKPRGHLARYA